MKYLIKNIRNPFFPELLFWIAALTYLAIIEPAAGNHYNFCLFSLAGIEHCPGCGLGKSISYVFHGNISASLTSHPIGILAVILIAFRIIVLFLKLKNYNRFISQIGVFNG